MKRFDPTPPWESHEVLLRDSEGELHEDCKRPFSASLLRGGDQIATALGLMWQLQFHGWPKAKQVMKDEHGKPRIVLSDEVDGVKIWILKAKPTCWRLYFYVYQEKTRIFYLHAVCKKKNAQNPSDARKARRIFNGVGGSTGSGSIAFDFPD